MVRASLQVFRRALGPTALCLLIARVPVWAQSGSVTVTPDGQTTPDRPPNTGGYTANFTVTNTGSAPDSFWISCGWFAPVTCTGVSDDFVTLAAGADIGISAFYNVGAAGIGEISLSAFSEASMATDDGYYTVPVVGPPPSNWDVTPFNHEHQVMGRCAAGCFAVTHAQSTVPYFSLDTPRNLTLVYHGDRVHPKPFIHLNVQKPDAQVPQQVWLEVKRSGADQTFANGETRLKFLAASSGYQRIGGQLRDSTLATGMHDVEIIVSWYYGASMIMQSWVTRLLVVNETEAPIARGWTIAGVQRLYPQANGHALITEGDGSAAFFKTGFVSPPGEFSMLETFGAGWRRRYPDSTKVVFNSLGLMTDVYDSFNNRTQFFYDGSNRLTTVRDPNGKDLVLAYGPNGLSSIRDNVTPNRYTTVTVQPSPTRTLTAISDPDNVSTGFAYDASRRLSSVTDRRGQTTTIGWQTVNGKATGKLSSVTAPQITVFENGQVQSAVPVTSFAPWQTVAVPYVLTGSAPAAVVLPSDVKGQVTEPSGKISRFTVDRWGQPVQTINALNQTTTVTYDGSGLPIKVQYPTGGADSAAYDGNGLPTYIKPSGLTATTVTYNATWKTQPQLITGSNRPSNRFWIGANGRVDSADVGGTGKTRYLYETFGRVTQVKDASNVVVETRQYSGINGNLSAVTTPQRLHQYGYDNYGRVTSDSIVNVGKRTFEYDVLNRQRKVWDGVNANPTESIYDNLYLIKVIDPALQNYEYGHNALGWGIWVEDAVGARDSVWYSRDGDVTRTRNRRGQIVRFYYDALHRLLAKGGTNTDSSTFAYNTAPGANWVRASNPYDTLTTNFSNDGLVTSEQTVFGGRTYTISAQYAAAGWVDSVWAVGDAGSFLVRRYVYNTDVGTLTDIRLGGKSASMTYDNKLRPTATSFTGGNITTRDFITTNPMARTEPDQGHLAEFGRRLEHDRGRIRSHFNTGGAAELGNFFGYDGLDRIKADTSAMVEKDLCTWNADDGWVCPPPTPQSVQVYSYDAAGNRLDQGGAYGIGNRITDFNGCSYSTDADGNVTSRICGDDTVRFHWTAENRLKALKVVGGDSVDFRYDALGRLVRRDWNASVQAYFLWSGDHVFAELDPSGVDRVEYSYYPGLDRPHAIGLAADTVYFAHFDGLGNVIGYVSEVNWLSASYGYDLWGFGGPGSENLQGQTNRARFKGALWLGDIGPELYYMRNRWYEPHSGRFLSEDPIGLAGGINPYVFAGNDPVNMRDPTGLGCKLWVWVVFDATRKIVAILGYEWECDSDDEGGSGGGGGGGESPQQPDRKPPDQCPAALQSPGLRNAADIAWRRFQDTGNEEGAVLLTTPGGNIYGVQVRGTERFRIYIDVRPYIGRLNFFGTLHTHETEGRSGLLGDQLLAANRARQGLPNWPRAVATRDSLFLIPGDPLEPTQACGRK